MAVPKQRHTKSRRDRRRSHHALSKQSLSTCFKCGAAVLPHRVCPNCGSYAGREVVDVLAKVNKKQQKAKKGELAKQEKKQTKGKELSLKELSQK